MSFFGKIKAIFSLKKALLPEEIIANFEEALINADADHAIIKKIIKPEFSKLQTEEEVKAAISNSMLSILKPKEREIKIEEQDLPFVIFVAGVNGSGKTTTIGKLASKFTLEGRKVLIGACDTFRAAATEQLTQWAEQAGAEIEKQIKEGEDPSAVCYRSLKRAKEEGFDVLIIDTSGRLQTNKALMAELTKMQSVLKKIDQTKPNLTLLILDGSAGQNTIIQGKEFAKFIHIDGICITKLDSSSKGGTLLSIANKFDFGIYFVGIGEEIADLTTFNSEEFIKSIFEE
jgi:fused signal recognition particle receptor